MRHSAGLRLSAALVLLFGAFGAPGSGLTHGAAHERAARHAAEHRAAREAHHHGVHDHEHASAGARAADASGRADEAHVGGAGHERDHGHAQVDDGMRPRPNDLPALRAERVAVPAGRELTASTGAVVLHAALPRADPATGPPPRLRAPPAA